MDTLDYSGSGLNEGSKVVMAAVGPPRRVLPTELPPGFFLPDGFGEPRIALPGVLTVQGSGGAEGFCKALRPDAPINAFPLVVLVDDSDFTARQLRNFLWVTFTRSNPAADIDGIGAETRQKHWGCEGSLVIDARIKPHHAPPLVEDPAITRRVDALAAHGGPLHGIL
jgi:4-hydroxy-3-polyprenylbenzoate decarboxylase